MSDFNEFAKTTFDDVVDPVKVVTSHKTPEFNVPVVLVWFEGTGKDMAGVF